MIRSWIQVVVLNKNETKKNDFASHFGIKGRNVLKTFNLYRVRLRSLSVSAKVSHKRVLKID